MSDRRGNFGRGISDCQGNFWNRHLRQPQQFCNKQFRLAMQFRIDNFVGGAGSPGVGEPSGLGRGNRFPEPHLSIPLEPQRKAWLGNNQNIRRPLLARGIRLQNSKTVLVMLFSDL